MADKKKKIRGHPKSKILGWMTPGRIYVMFIHPKDPRLTTDAIYQRDIVERHLAEMEANWLGAGYGCLILIESQSGRLQICDGKHRKKAIDDLGLDELLLAIVHVCPENIPLNKFGAQAFNAINKKRMSVNALQGFASGVCSGEKDALLVKDVLREYGYGVARKEGLPDCRIMQYAAALRGHAKRNPETFKKAIYVMATVHNGSNVRTHGSVFKGIAVVAEEAQRMDGVEEDVFSEESLEKLKKVGMAGLKEHIHQFAHRKNTPGGEIGGTTRRVPGNAILEIINAGRPLTSLFMLRKDLSDYLKASTRIKETREKLGVPDPLEEAPE